MTLREVFQHNVSGVVVNAQHSIVLIKCFLVSFCTLNLCVVNLCYFEVVIRKQRLNPLKLQHHYSNSPY